MADLLLILPAYNEEKNIASVIEGLRLKAPKADILVIDDGSKDRTSDVCKELGVTVVRHKVNLGLAEGVRTGMKYALSNGYDYAMQFDSDGQHDENSVMAMLELARKECADIVIGSRYLEKSSSPFMKSVGRRLISFCIKVSSGSSIKDPTSGMRLYNRKTMEKFTSSYHYSPEPDMLSFLIKTGSKVLEYPVHMQERKSGRSYLDITESIRYMFRMCTSILIIQWFR